MTPCMNKRLQKGTPQMPNFKRPKKNAKASYFQKFKKK